MEGESAQLVLLSTPKRSVSKINEMCDTVLMKLPKSLTTVTPFSKYLALSVLVIFPILAFFLGRVYEKAQCISARQASEMEIVPNLD